MRAVIVETPPEGQKAWQFMNAPSRNRVRTRC